MATEEYRAWIASINASNRARALESGGVALITDPDTGRQRMEGLRPGEMVWYDVKDGPQSQRGRRYFCGPDWHGPFPEYGTVATTEGPQRGPPTLGDRLRACLQGGTPDRPAPTLMERIRATLRGGPGVT